MSVKYLKGSLFDAPEGSLLVHACNTQGVWGSGIAREFKNRYPKSFEQYNGYCTLDGSRHDIRGEFQYISMIDEDHSVGCLFTSGGFGSNVDDVETILIHTVLAVDQAMIDALKYSGEPTIKIYSNKFNSGLFGVPWYRTEKIINTLLRKHPRVEWIVYTGE